MDEQQPQPPRVIDFGDDEQKIHWLKMIDYHNEQIEELMKKVKEHQEQRAEALDEFYADVPKHWDVIKVAGRPVYERETKEGSARVYIEDLKAKYPRIYEELKRKKPGEKVNRLGGL